MNVNFKQHKGYDPLGDCGKGKCPLCARNQAVMRSANQVTKKEFQSDSVAPFVGDYGYPSVNVGILSPPLAEDESWKYDAPLHWSQQNLQIPQIVRYRSSLLNSRYTHHIRKQNKLLELSQELALASKPTDIDVNLKKKPSYQLSFDPQAAPTGATAQLQKVKITANPNIHTKVQKVYGDNDLKAQQALTYLYDNSFDENFLTRILSVGTIGMKKNRKLVPTRWSITATDDTLGKHLIQEVRDFQQTNYSAYFGEYLGNYYLILVLPDLWSYELFECYVSPKHLFTTPLKYMTDHEGYSGRKYYAQQTAGGYYTVRLAIAEHFKKIKRQGTALALRFITDDYTTPLGVWVTRQAARNAMNSTPIQFSSKELLLDYARKLIKRKFSANVDQFLKKSVLLNQVKQQTKLASYI